MPPDDHDQRGRDDEGSGRGARVRPADVLGHAQMLRQGEQAAEALARLGVREGDPVAVLLPMCLESVIVTLACIRLGAMRITLPVGNHLGFVRNRIRSSGARVVVSADSCRQDDAVQDVKAVLDRALWGCPGVHTVLVVSQLARPVPWEPGRDLWWHEALAARTPTPPGGPYAGLMTSTPNSPEGRRPQRQRRERLAALDFGDPLDQRAPDDADEGWGERLPEDPALGGGGVADLARFLNERPPHHL
ncbi:AMP-binding protein [Streptomyces sp. 6N223]|uniref:AMP-binding protein n=1 Tax=Streptomyces sp. 6N223 TaxID=3457412 RepID=UPI003FD24BF1